MRPDPTHEDAARSRRSLRWTAAAGALVWLGLGFVPGAPDGSVDRVLLLAVLTVVPLGFALLPSLGSGERALLGAIALLLPLAAAAAVASLWKADGGIAAVLASPWLGLTGLGAALGLLRLVGLARRRAPRDASGVLTVAASLFLPVGGAWLIAARSGQAPAEYDPLIVTMTAVHFHYAAFAAPMMTAATLRWLGDSPQPPSAITAGAMTIGFVAGVPLVAFGIAAVPAFGVVGSVLLALAALVWAALVLVRVVPRGGWLPRTLLVLSTLSPLLSMPLAVAWAWGEMIGNQPLELLWMLRLHGYANAYGFVLCGLVGWTAIVAAPPITARKSA